jgi:hypothetical protein
LNGKQSAAASETGQDLSHQILEWKIERFGWVVWALIILAALAGLLGEGPLSDQVAGEPGSVLWVEYNRFERYQTPTKMTIHVSSDDPHIRLWINYGFMRKIEVTHMDPDPERVEVGSDRYIFPLTLTDRNKETVITVYFKINEAGMMHTEAGLENGPSLRFTQFVYP